MKGAGLKPAATKSVKTDFFTPSGALGYVMSLLPELNSEAEFFNELLTRDTSNAKATRMVRRYHYLRAVYNRYPHRKEKSCIDFMRG
jgi:hypothetical protein